MKKGSQRGYYCRYIGAVIAFFAVIALCNVASADNVITAKLKASSYFGKPGGKILFAAEIFYNPAFNMAPGTMMHCWVTRDDFSWVSPKVNVPYPEPGKTRDFAFGISEASYFHIPQNARSGQVYNFFLVYGIWYPISEKVSIKVVSIKQEDMKQKTQTGR